MRKKILLLVLGLISGCTQPSITVVAPQSTAPIVKQSDVVAQVTPSSNSQSQVSDVVTPNTQVVVMPDGTLMPKGNGRPENVVNPTPTPVPTSSSYTNSQPYTVVSPEPIYPTTNNYSPIKPEERGQGKPATPCDRYGNTSSQCSTYLESQKPPKPTYPIFNYNVPDDIKTGDISIDFKDEYKVRVSKDPNAIGFKLTAQSGQDQLKEVEKILLEYKVEKIRFAGYSFDNNEQKSNEYEILKEKECECDYPSMLSRYAFYLENQNMKEMIEKLRLNPIVRQVNPSPIGSI